MKVECCVGVKVFQGGMALAKLRQRETAHVKEAARNWTRLPKRYWLSGAREGPRNLSCSALTHPLTLLELNFSFSLTLILPTLPAPSFFARPALNLNLFAGRHGSIDRRSPYVAD